MNDRNCDTNFPAWKYRHGQKRISSRQKFWLAEIFDGPKTGVRKISRKFEIFWLCVLNVVCLTDMKPDSWRRLSKVRQRENLCAAIFVPVFTGEKGTGKRYLLYHIFAWIASVDCFIEQYLQHIDPDLRTSNFVSEDPSCGRPSPEHRRAFG